MWTLLRLPVIQGGREQVLIAHGGAFPVDLRSILEALAAQLTLALGRVHAARAVYLARTERRFHSMVQHSSDLITLLDADRRVIYQSPAVAVVLGRSPASLVGHPLRNLVHPDDLVAVRAQLTKVLSGGRSGSAGFECRVANSEGQWLTVDVAATNLLDEPDVGAIVLNSRDVTERRALEGELKRQAFHDTLTGLANRALFLDRLSHAMDRGDRTLDPVAVLFLDIDDFKTVNDSLGHPAGDLLLIAVAGRLKAATRPGDTVARFGGDEFAVLVETGAMPQAAEEVLGELPKRSPRRSTFMAMSWRCGPASVLPLGSVPTTTLTASSATPTLRRTSPSAMAKDALRCTGPTCTPRPSTASRLRPTCAVAWKPASSRSSTSR
jgi:PAS domain S-box-containing protein